MLNQLAPLKPQASRQRWFLLAILFLATILRLVFIIENIENKPYDFFPDSEEIAASLQNPSTPFVTVPGYEASNIAWAILHGQGFASPFGGMTGPTAWIAPGIVALYVASFAVFGCFTIGSILALYFFALALSLATIVIVNRLATTVSGKPVAGLVAAFLFALVPQDAWLFRVSGQMDFNVVTFLFALVLLLVVRFVVEPSLRRVSTLGTISAIAALFFPGFLLCTAAVLLLGWRRKNTGFVVQMLVFAGLHLCVITPYLVWQHARTGEWVPIKSNAPFEVYLGNTPEARGILKEEVFELYHPSQNAEEFMRYRAEGEGGYVRAKFNEFRQNITLGAFAAATQQRIKSFYVSYDIKTWDTSRTRVVLKQLGWMMPTVVMLVYLAIRRLKLNRAQLTVYIFVLAYSVPYLAAGVLDRYRAPIISAPIVLCSDLLVCLASGVATRVWKTRSAVEAV